MAWIATATNNADLVQQLTDLGVLEDPQLINAFRLTDRGDFVTPQHKHEAYYDRPFKRSYVHLSAPHMYATVLKELDLKPGHAFLNVGSGSGYLSCLVACLLGKNGLSHGIDVNEDVVNHSQECTQKWFERHKQLVQEHKQLDHQSDIVIPEILEEGVHFVYGNCFNIDVFFASQTCKYDRIYIGAGCDDDKKEFFYSLLSDNGVMILPVNSKNVLLKVIRKSRSVFAEQDISRVNFAPLVSATITPLVKLPPVLWAPLNSRHQQYPASFRDAVLTLLLSASRLPSFQVGEIDTDLSSVKHSFPYIPTQLWMYVLTFTSRNWFIPTLTEVECLTEDLNMERSMRVDSEEKLKTTVKKLQRAEQERDLYKTMMMRIHRVITNNPHSTRTQLVQMLNNSIIAGAIPQLGHPINYASDDSDNEEDDEEESVEGGSDNGGEDDQEEDEDEYEEEEDVGVVASASNEDEDVDEDNNEVKEDEEEMDNETKDAVPMEIDQHYDTFDIKIEGWFIV